MDMENFLKTIGILSTCGLVIDEIKAEVWFNFLKDIELDDMKEAIVNIVNTVEKIYPGDNIIAIIRKEAGFIRSLKNNRKITTGRLYQ